MSITIRKINRLKICLLVSLLANNEMKLTNDILLCIVVNALKGTKMDIFIAYMYKNFYGKVFVKVFDSKINPLVNKQWPGYAILFNLSVFMNACNYTK